MTTDDRMLDRFSRRLLATLDRLRGLETEKRGQARSTPRFHELEDQTEQAAAEVWRISKEQHMAAEEDSPIPEERAEQVPGDWTHKQPQGR
jgi:hypothetical protein